MAGRAILVALLPLSVFGFTNTHPLVAWSSHRSNALSAVPAALSYSSDILENIFAHEDICSHDAIIVVEQEGLHASDLRTLSSDCALSKALSASPTNLQRPYIRTNTSNPLSDASHSLARRCSSRLSSHTLEQVGNVFESQITEKEKHMIRIKMPAFEQGLTGASRKAVMSSYESKLASALETLTNAFSNHLVVYTGRTSPRSSLVPRQTHPNPFTPASSSESATQPSPSQSGILHNYRLLTPALVLALLLVFFVLLPAVFLGVNALASISVPPGLGVDPSRSWSAGEKKNQ